MVPLYPQELYVTNWEAYKALRDIKTKKAAGPEKRLKVKGMFIVEGALSLSS